MQLEKNYCSLPPHPPFYSHLSLFHLSFPPFISLSPCFPVLLSPFPQTLAMKSVPPRNPGPRYQPTSPMPPRFFGHPSLNPAACSSYLASLQHLLSTLHSFVVLSFSLLIFILPLLLPLLVSCPCQKAYRQP